MIGPAGANERAAVARRVALLASSCGLVFAGWELGGWIAAETGLLTAMLPIRLACCFAALGALELVLAQVPGPSKH